VALLPAAVGLCYYLGKSAGRSASPVADLGLRADFKDNAMLIGISPLVSPDLLAVLCRMGHGDEIVLADAHFPGETFNHRVLRADGLKIADLLDAILPLI